MIEELGKLGNIISEKKKAIAVKARELLNELRKLDNWEVLIDCCKEHYKQFPDEFFGWCHVEFDNNKVYFVKGYRDDDDDYYVLTIDLSKPLKEQIKERQEEIKKDEEKEAEKIRAKELAELNRLKEKYEKEV